MARLVGQKISEALGQPIVFENKPGANAIIGTDVVAKAAPDGYTFGTRSVVAATTTEAPQDARRRAHAIPMPVGDPAPVTSAV